MIDGIYFFITVIVIGFISSLMHNYSGKIAGFVYGSLPLTYIYLYSLSAKYNKRKEFSINSLYSAFSWGVFVYITYLTSHISLVESLGVSFIFYIIILYLQYKFIEF